MTEQELRSLVEGWDTSTPPGDDLDPGKLTEASDYLAKLDRLLWFGENVWSNYLPSQHGHYSPRYMARLADWVGNLSDPNDQKLLLEYAGRITYLSREDMEALYRAAFEGPITRWIITQTGLRLCDTGFQINIKKAIHQQTWFCPVTDSLDINEFYHINRITGIGHRPAFASIQMLLDNATADIASHIRDRIESFLNQPNKPGHGASELPLKWLVLVEDFVGSGVQAKKILETALEMVNRPVLFVPLIICPKGRKLLEELRSKYPDRLWISPVIDLTCRDLLGPAREQTECGPLAPLIEALADQTFETVAGGNPKTINHVPYTSFGWRKVGGSIVTYSNSPNTTLPLIHHEPANGGWKPLFPRSARV